MKCECGFEPVLGQEAVVPKYGLGRVTAFNLSGISAKDFVEVKPYIAGYEMRFSPDNVKLVKLDYADSH